MPTGLELHDVTFAYPGAEPVLRDLSLRVPRGKLTVVLGPNGSGKTTLLRLAAGLARPDRGAVSLDDGREAAAASRAGLIGYVPQHLGLVRNATAFEAARAGALGRAGGVRGLLGLHASDASDEAYRALDLVGMREKADVRVSRLSGGEKQRVAIARTLVQKPKVIVADELLASLDVVQAHTVMEIQKALKGLCITTLMSLHQVDVALAHADELVFLREGAAKGPMAAVGMTAEEARCALVA